MSEVVNISAKRDYSLKSVDQQLEDYISLLQCLTVENLHQLQDFVDDEVEFIDPFHCIRGQNRMIQVFEDMFKRLDGIKFEVFDWQYQRSNEGYVVYLYWQFSADSSTTGVFQFEGSSRLLLNADGIILKHHDFWDATELMLNLPLLGRLLGFIKKRAASKF